jgi:hypothetical protein
MPNEVINASTKGATIAGRPAMHKLRCAKVTEAS